MNDIEELKKEIALLKAEIAVIRRYLSDKLSYTQLVNMDEDIRQDQDQINYR